MRTLRVVFLLLLALWMAAAPSPALSRKVILKLREAALARYPQGMPAYAVLVYRGKAFASTRGTADGAGTVAVWEYDGGRWQWVFEHPLHPADTKAVNLQYRRYGFTVWQQKRLLRHWRRFPRG